VTFVGWTSDVSGEIACAGMFLASAPAEPLGLAVLEAMAAGLPVVACASGGHLETVGQLPSAPLFPAGDARAAASVLRSLRSDSIRGEISAESRRLVAERFTIERHVDRLLVEYEAAGAVAADRRGEGVAVRLG
jgi:glycosyltransferase involved in cell wall biosynthesis